MEGKQIKNMMVFKPNPVEKEIIMIRREVKKLKEELAILKTLLKDKR
jgi:hypothetical protein